MLKVSIIIPTYRHRDFILKSLDSVFAQTLQDYEVIVVNDGSPDDTKTVLQPLIESRRIQYLEQANQGQSQARNRGIELARGEYIAFLDDDDVWPKDKLEWQSAYLDNHPDVALVGGVLQTMDENDCPGWKGNFHPSLTFESLFAENPFLSPGQTLIRADVLKQVGSLNTKVWGADDWDLWFRIAKVSKTVMLDRLALFYRLHPNNASKQAGRLLRGACQTVTIHLKDVDKRRQGEIRRLSHRNLYGGLGIPLVKTAKEQLRAGRFLQAAKTLYGLWPLRKSILCDERLRPQFFKEILISPIKRKLRLLIPKKRI